MKQKLDDIIQLGEGQYIEFKETLDKSFAKEKLSKRITITKSNLILQMLFG